MRVASAASSRGTSGQVLRDLPTPGTKLRLAYDLFYLHRGRTVPMDELQDLRRQVSSGKTRNTVFGSLLWQLRDFYGCDIRQTLDYRAGLALVGEWCGRVYIDYTQPAVEAEET